MRIDNIKHKSNIHKYISCAAIIAHQFKSKDGSGRKGLKTTIYR